MATRETILTALIFGAYLLAPAVAGIFGMRSEPFENRTLAAVPKMMVGRILDQEMYREISDYLDDHLPIRRPSIWTDAKMDVELFGDSPHPSVRMGENQWLFFNESLILAGKNERPVEHILLTLGTIGRELEASGREFWVILIPNKYTVYPEHASETVHQLARAGMEKRQALQAQLRSGPLPGFMDLAPVMIAVKNDYRLNQFFPDDTHITSFGAVVIARSLLDAMHPGIWEDDVLIGPKQTLRLGDLAQMMVVRRAIPNAVFRVRREGVSFVTPELIPQPKGFRMEILRASSESKPMIKGRTLIIHDSSMNLPRIMLHPFFEELHLVNWNSFDAELSASMMVAADRVIVQAIERDFYWRVEELLGDPEFLSALEARLRPP